MTFRSLFVLSAALACATAVAADNGSPRGGSWSDFSDGLDVPQALDLAAVLSESKTIGMARDADAFIRNAESLDAEEAACGDAYTDASGPTVPSACAESDECRECYEEAVRKIDFNRYYIERARCITAANVKMANSAVAFGDSASGIHAVAGLSWQLQGKPQIEEAVAKLKQTYTTKAAQYLGNLQGALQELGQCEAQHYGETDWYQRYGWIYHNFMKAKYAAPPE
jgi:hypothetical protein